MPSSTTPDAALRRAVAGSFERITVDGQMSTNDTVLLQASGASGRPLPGGLLEAVLLQLALLDRRRRRGRHARRPDRRRGAADDGEAERVARAIANSPLVKTALYGRDPELGPDRPGRRPGARRRREVPELGPDRIDAAEMGDDTAEPELSIDLGRGEAAAHVFFSDLTHEYIRINAEYTT